MAIRLYGIPNCDTVKKARAWLNEQKIDHDFVNFKTHMVAAKTLEIWLERLGADSLINKRGTTWRKLTDAQKSVDSSAALIDLMRENSSVIKRPVLDVDGQFYVGFSVDSYASIMR